MSVPIHIGSSKSAVKPGLLPLPVLFIRLPVTIVRCSICSDELSLAMFHIILPVADVVAAVEIYHPSVPILLTFDPVAIVALPIWPNLLPMTMPLRSTPLAVIDGAIEH